MKWSLPQNGRQQALPELLIVFLIQFVIRFEIQANGWLRFARFSAHHNSGGSKHGDPYKSDPDPALTAHKIGDAHPE